MKNLLKSIVLLIGASILISSCGSKWALTKRHYRPGYYSDYASKQSAPKLKVEEKANKKQIIIASQKVDAPVIENSVSANVNTGNNPAVKQIEKPVTKKHTVLSASNFVEKVKSTVQKPKIILKNKTQKMLVDGDDGGRSLFWTVILIILILWIIGFLVGGFELYGGLINLLLLIALILFILWLLRVI